MIYTITPNATLDLGGLVKKILANEKNYVEEETRFPGGNAINAARMIKRLGLPVITSGFLGGGIGSEIEALLKQEGIATRFVKIKESSRINVTVSNQKIHAQTRLSFPGPRISVEELQKLFKQVARIGKSDLVIIGGSLPLGVSPSSIKHIIKLLKMRGISTLVDLPSADLKKVIFASPLFIKPNLLEFQEIVGKKVSSVDAVIREAKKLLKRVPLICVSSVDGGALLISEGSIWYGRAPKVKVRTTVGAGDSMVGAIASHLFTLFKKKSSQRIENLSATEIGNLLRWGLASAAATLETHGTELGGAKKIREHFLRVKIKRLDGSARSDGTFH
jgi:1-phosphofructokinase family hexose kinase